MKEEESDHPGIVHSTYKVTLPRLIIDEDIGLGDVFKHMTTAFGISPCGDCQRRADMLNRWLVFRGRAK